MTHLNQAELEHALRECASEPIHQIAHIQPHGALLVLSADSRRVVLQASDNLETFIGIKASEALGKHLAELLGANAIKQIETLILTAKKKRTATGQISLTVNQKISEIPAHLYISEEMIVLEFAHDDGFHQEGQLAQLLLEFQQNLLSSEDEAEIPAYFDEIVSLIRALTGYDSVMTYRFDANWDGQIIAQDRSEKATSFLGMHFPSSDIPPQARRLYTQNLVRVVADIDAQRVPVLPALNPATQQPLDMSYSALRSLSPIHMEYLRNMGVQASMTISLMKDDQLWGLIACHHFAPKRVSIALREAAILISRMVSSKLSAFEAIEQRSKVDRGNEIVRELLNSLTSHNEEEILQKLLPELQALLDSTGIIMVVEGKPYMHGSTPEIGAVNELLVWLGSQFSAKVYSCDFLGKVFPPATAYVDIAAGVLATPLSSDALNCIVWLRKEQPRTVNWAGNYADGLVKNAVGNFRLTPRKSFELWEESWRGRSVPWTPVELGIAAMMALALPESLAQKNKIAQEQEKLKQAEEEIRTMAFYDSLTKLPNRRLLGDRLTQTMAASKRSGSYVAVFFLDLDNFKSLNDTNGHAVGDLLLIEVARRLKSCLREVDTAARLGGDEFVVVLSELGVDKFKSIQQAESVAEKIREALAATYVLNVEHEEDKHNIVEHRCTSSIGAVVFVNHEVSQDDILKYADNAMYQAKHAGRNTVRFYNFTN